MPKNKSPLYVETVAVTPMKQDAERHNTQIGKPKRIGLVDVQATKIPEAELWGSMVPEGDA